MDHPSSMSTRIVTAVAEREGVDPVEMSPPLHDAVDLEEVDTLFSGADGSLQLAFRYDGYRIVADGSGAIEITDRTAAADGSGESQPSATE